MTWITHCRISSTYITNAEAAIRTIAVIDIGSNTIRLLVARKEGKTIVRLFSDRVVTRLGKNLISRGVFNRHSIDLSISSLSKFKVTCDMYAVEDICVVGTSAMREASDSSDFIQSVKQETGLEIRVLSGREEAELTLSGMKEIQGSGQLLAVDIGGGSSEFILSGDPPLIFSLPVGAVKLHEKFINNDPPSLQEIESIRAFISTELKTAMSAIMRDKRFADNCILVATGGSPTTLAAISLAMPDYDGDRIHGYKMGHSEVCSIFERLASMPFTERLNVMGMEKERADIILPGAMILTSIMELLSIKTVTVSDYGLMEGIILARD